MRALHAAYPPVYLQERDFATFLVVPVGYRSRPVRAPAKGTPRARHQRVCNGTCEQVVGRAVANHTRREDTVLAAKAQLKTHDAQADVDRGLG